MDVIYIGTRKGIEPRMGIVPHPTYAVDGDVGREQAIELLAEPIRKGLGLRCHTRLIGWKLWLYAVIGPVAMGGVIELLQRYCTNTRSGEWLDFLADTVGVVLGAALGLLLYRLFFRKKYR